MATDLSAIVPVLNEEKLLPAFLQQSDHWPITELIIIDGGSQDQTQAILRAWQEGPSSTRHRFFLTTEAGRAKQMNKGAEVAAGSMLLFLHADSILPLTGFDALFTALQDPHVVGGAFRLQIDSPSLFLKSVSKMANLRSSLLGLPYGDQGIFVRKEIFEKIGGYANLPLMEDVDFIHRLKQQGRLVLLQDKITTSARRWELPAQANPSQWNRWRKKYLTSIRNVILLLLYLMGVHPKKLAEWYN